jgi:hypothetical protein
LYNIYVILIKKSHIQIMEFPLQWQISSLEKL